MKAELTWGASLDSLSAKGRAILRHNAADAYERLTVGSSDGDQLAKPLLEAVAPDGLIDGSIVSADDAAAVHCGLWLRHDWLDPAHVIAQGIGSPTGSLWHAIIHRREGDFSNSKYWYSRAGGHSAFHAIAARAEQAINAFPADKSVFRVVASGWNPGAFVDLVEQVHDRAADPRHGLCVAIQELEWQTLFEHCVRAAAGR